MRVWGTFKYTLAGGIVTTLKKLTTVGDHLTVKGVYRRGSANGRDRWWLGEGDLLKQLEGEWERITLQTNWKLELYTKPASNDTSCGHSGHPEPGHADEISEQPDDPTHYNNSHMKHLLACTILIRKLKQW